MNARELANSLTWIDGAVSHDDKEALEKTIAFLNTLADQQGEPVAPQQAGPEDMAIYQSIADNYAAPSIAARERERLQSLSDEFKRRYETTSSPGYKVWDAARMLVDDAIRALEDES